MGKTLFDFGAFNEQIFGRVTGTFNTSRFPSLPGRFAKLKAYGSNGGSIFIGDGKSTGMFPMPMPLQANYETEWFPLVREDTDDDLGNLNTFYMNGASGSSYLMYWVLR